MYTLRPILAVAALSILTLGSVGCGSKTALDHLASAQEYLIEDERSTAEVELKNALQKDPQLAEAHALLGRIRYAKGDIQLALKDLNRATDLGAEDEETRLTLLNAKLRLGLYSEVIGALEDQSGLSDDFEILLAEAYLLARDPDSAQVLFQKNLHVGDGLLGMAKVAFLENDLERAANYVDQAVVKDAENADAWLFKGEVELAQDNTDAAELSFKHAVEMPSSAVTARLGLARTYLVANNLDAARAAVDTAIQAAKNSPQAHYLRAVISYQQNDLDAAEQALDTVEKISQGNVQAMYLLGVVKYRQGRVYQARSILRRYLKQDINNVSARKLLASIASDQNDYEDVVDLLQSIAPHHSDPQIWAMLGTALMSLGKTETATEALETAVELAPDMAAFRNQLALGLLSSGQEQRAIAELDSAIQLGGEQRESDYLLIMVKTRDGDYAGANKALDDLLAKDPDNAVAYNLRGAIAMAQGDQESAAAAFEQSVALAADYFPPVMNMARIAEQNGDFDAAERLLTSASEAGNERAALSLVDLAIRRQQFDVALERINTAVQNFPESVPAHMGAARLLMATGKLSRAREAVDAARELSGDAPEVLLLKADISLRQGNRGDAAKIARKLQQVVVSNADNTNVLAAVGALQLRVDNLTGARRNLSRAIKLAEEASDQPMIPAMVNLVKLELAEDNAGKAQSWLQKLNELGVAGEEIALLQGDTLVAAGRNEDARKLFAQMAGEGSRAGTSKYVLLELQAGNYEKVEQVLDDWLQQYPNDGGMQQLLASARVQLGQAEAAKAQYEAMMPTKDPVVLNNLAWIYMLDNDPRALELARQANIEAPGNPDIEDTLGWILVNSGEVEEGLDFLRNSARERPNNASVQFHLGVAYQKLGERNSAIKALEKALTIGDFNEVREARKLLEALRSS